MLDTFQQARSCLEARKAEQKKQRRNALHFADMGRNLLRPYAEKQEHWINDSGDAESMCCAA
jgi:hypothetical protein